MNVHHVTVQQKDKKERKGLIPYLSRLFKGSGAVGSGEAATGVTGAAGRGLFGGLLGGGSPFGGGFLATLLGTKAGIAGLTIGAMTLLAGLGLAYNVMRNNSSGDAARGLFSDPYYDALVSDAQSNRMAKSNVVDSKSSLDYFNEANASDDVADEAAVDDAGAAPASDTEETKADASAASPAASIPRLAATSGMGLGGSSGGSGGSSSSGAIGSGATARGGSTSAGAVRTGQSGAFSSSVRAGRTAGTRKAGALSGARNQARAVGTTLGGAGSSADSRRGALVDAYENNDKSGEVASGGAGLSSGSGASDPAAMPKDSTNLGNPTGGSGSTADTTESEESTTPWAKISQIAKIALIAANALLLLITFAPKLLSLAVSQIIAKVVMVIGLAVMAYGLYLMFAQGQRLEGLAMAASGLLTAVAGFKAMTGLKDLDAFSKGSKTLIAICSVVSMVFSGMSLFMAGGLHSGGALSGVEAWLDKGFTGIGF
ncbi:MAG: hypothetical protein PHW69_02490 [Elusimicrobiaceae bacterium]|nr:hypothetical protein [Elusimicrobiaceae bacterium]